VGGAGAILPGLKAEEGEFEEEEEDGIGVEG
jgi:hypothetical protein